MGVSVSGRKSIGQIINMMENVLLSSKMNSGLEFIIWIV